AKVRYGIGCSWRDQKRVRTEIIRAWGENGLPKFKESDGTLYVVKKYDDVIRKDKAAVSSELGAMKPVTVPEDLAESYEYLASPLENSVVGVDGCDVAGVVPWGKTSIDSIVKERRVDLLENILRGFNPGGRVYAVMALKDLQRNGTKLSQDTLATM